MKRTPDPETERNLRDAGCDEETIGGYCDLESAGVGPAVCRREQIRLLRAHRRALLEQLHSCQRRLDCLDFLIYHLRCERTEGSER